MEAKINLIDDSKVVISPLENIDFSNAHKFKEKLLEVFNDDYKMVIIDFAKVESIDSSGLGKLLLFHKKLKENDKTLIIRNIESDYLKKMFDMIHLNKVIKIED